MTTLLADFLGQFLPFIIAGITALVGVTGYVWNAKRKAKAEGVAQQQAKEAAANAKDIDIIHRATGAQPSRGVSDDPDNRDNAKG